ncbi:MAG: serine/threonine-protein kinase [Rudaea sp.]|nr:serine/threonine-protein kinase [Rudaea sp.]
MTSSTRFAEIRRLFDLVCDLPADTQRERLTTEGADAGLIAEVQALLAAQTGSLRRAAIPVDALLASLPETELGVGERVGAWRLVRKLGSGGMGAVYLAERADGHFRQQAAIKLLRGFPTADTLARLAAERQILAALQHPDIARLLDGGATPSGQPYLVMEYVEGVPIDRYCADRHLDLLGRLRLFQRVCRAVQAAHQQLIVHCDLKPSNVLVRADGVPALLDFGVARALDRSGGAAAEHQGGNFFTPHYASPEQRLGVDISTTSDVYSLGLILFELLSGRSPQINANERTVAGLVSGEYRPSLLALPSVCPWRHRLRGDLDAIVLRATATRPTVRYASAETFADDIERHLQLRPVQARAQSLRYRYARLLRRRWPAFAAGALFVLLGVLFTWRVVSERDRALAAEHEARLQADTASQVSDFLVSVFEVVNPEVGSKRDISAREVLDQGSKRIDRELASQPGVRARLLDVLARAYWMLGKPDRAIDLYRRAADAWRDPAVGQPLEAAESLSKLAVVLSNNNHDARAEAAAREALVLRQTRLPANDLALADSWNTLGLVLAGENHFAEAEDDFRKSLTIRVAQAGPESMEVAITLHNIGLLYRDQERFAEATDSFRRALAIERMHHDDSFPAVMQTLSDLAKTLTRDGKSTEAIPLLTRILAARKQNLGELNDDVANDYNELGYALEDAGRFAEAAANYRSSMDLYARMNEDGTRGFVLPLNNLAFASEDMGDYAQAEPLFRQSLELRQKLYPADDPSIARAEHNLARLLISEGKLDSAKPLLDHALSERIAKLGVDQPDTARSQMLLAEWWLRRNDPAQAQGALDTLAKSGARFTPLMTAQRLQLSGRIALARDDQSAALEDLRLAREAMIGGWGENHPLTAAMTLDYVAALRADGQSGPARILLERIRPIIEAAFVPASPMRRQLDKLISS